MQFIEIPHATIDHSGIYSCAALLHISPDLFLVTEHEKRSLVVYTPPTITGLKLLTQNELKMCNYPLDSDIILYDVVSSVPFNVTWLFNGKIVNYTTSKCELNSYTSNTDHFTCILEVPHASQDNGEYEYVVNTEI